MKKIFILILVASIFVVFDSVVAKADTPLVSFTYEKGAFPLNGCSIIFDKSDFDVVKNTASLLASDIEEVTDIKPYVNPKNIKDNAIIIGTLGKNRWIDKLVSDKKLDVSEIRGGWEQFVIKRVDNPIPKVKRALIIVGSDRRGTAYGAFTISEKIGVSPWSWWADVPVRKHKQLFLVSDYISDTPSVKYRGIFINDEDWGLKPWSSTNFEKDLKDIGPKTYEKVFELLLRLKGNMLAPAMHSCTGAFYTHPESKVIADKYGIMITTSHCEPMLFNNACKLEWDSKIDGEWNYATNKDRILKKFEDRLSEASQYENIYTVAMRGLHDEALRGNLSPAERVNVLANVIKDQRAMLQRHLNIPSEKIPQIFVPYKETMEVYESGLQVPNDITLVWPDDNYGYMKRLSNPEEQKRTGRSGVYYHLSYLGAPHDYLWICTTPTVLMYAELKKAYDTGADRYWLLNVGDIKPGELAIQTFFDLGWNISNYDYTNINHVQSQFLSNIYGGQYKEKIQHILDTYYRLAGSRKPEFMGWEREWDSNEFTGLKDTEYSFQNYNDAQQRLADYKMIADMTDSLMVKMPEESRASFFELLAYPVQGAYQMNRKFLMAQLNHEKIKANEQSEANWAAKESHAAFDSIATLTKRYNTMLQGKWKGMMDLAPAFNALYQNMPNVTYVDGKGEKVVNLLPIIDKYRLDSCMVLDLSKYKNKISAGGHRMSVIEGIGYDWASIQLGNATEKVANPIDGNGDRFEYEFTCDNADSVALHIYMLPFFPLYKGQGNQFGVSVDGQSPQILDNKFSEFSKPWKDQVLQNGKEVVVKFGIDKGRKHIVSFICGSPGVIIQRVIIDWGGLKKSYVGPAIHSL